MKNDGLYNIWKKEEDIAHIHGWDFSHLYGRYEEESDLPWDYEKIVKQYLSNEKQLMDYDTGGAEFLLSLKHPFHMTSATEGYPPNVELCKELLLPLGVNFKECSTPKNIPFADDSFDLMINRHGDFDPNEIYRLLKTGGIFITEQVGCDNDRDLVKMVLSDVPKPFPQLQRQTQREKFEEAGFQIINTEEAYKPIKFYDIGAFVWYAHIIEWEFPNFSVDKCYEELLKMHETVEKCGKLEGTIHRFLIVAKK
jgi:SAM-dependent methyltransferase